MRSVTVTFIQLRFPLRTVMPEDAPTRAASSASLTRAVERGKEGAPS